MPDKSRDLYRGILIPDGDITEIWTDESTIDQAGNRAGIPDTPSRTEAVIESSGHQDDTGDGQTLDVLTLRGGYPSPGGAGFGWRQPNAVQAQDQEYRGWDVPHAISAWENSRWGFAGGSEYVHADLVNVTRSDGSDFMLCAYEIITPVSIAVAIQTRTGVVWSIAISFPSDSFQALIGDYTCHPAIVALPSGRILVFYWVYDHVNNTAQIQMAYNDGEGAPTTPWRVGGEYTLTDAIDTTTITTKRIRVAYKDGQILIIAHIVDTSTAFNDRLIQFASDDLGATFTTITEFDGSTFHNGGISPDIGVVNETFLVAWVSTNSFLPRVMRLGSAFDPINPLASDIPFPYPCASFELPAGSPISESNLTLAVDEDGAAYLFTTGFDYAVSAIFGASGLAARSFDGGITWEAMGTGTGSSFGEYGRWWGPATPDAAGFNCQPVDYTAAFQRSQLVLVHGYRNTTGDPVPGQGLGENSLCFLYMGSYGTVTLPGLEKFKRDTKRAGLPVTWLPFCIPSSLTMWAGVTAGAGATTEEINDDGFLRLKCAVGNSRYYSVSPSVGSGETQVEFTDGFYGRFTYNIQPFGGGGTSFQEVKIRVSNGAPGGSCMLFLNLGNAFFQIEDGTTTTILTSVPYQVGVDISKREVLWAVRGTSVGEDPPILGAEYCVWMRASDATSPAGDLVGLEGPDRTFALISQGTLALGGIGGNSFVRWGDQDTTQPSDVAWYGFNLCYGHTSSGDPLTGEHLAQGQDNPNDLFPRSYAAAPLFVDANTRIATVDGPTFEQDTWTVNTRFLDAADNVIPSVSPSPAKIWRSKTASAGDAIAFERNPDGENAFPLNCLYGVHFQNVNFKRARIETMIGAAWVSAGDCDLFEPFQFERRGHTLHIANGVAQKMYCYYNEFAGCRFEFDPDDVDSQVATILRNSEGMAYSGSAPKTTTIALDPNTFDAATAPTTGIGHLWFKTITFLFEFPLNGRFVGIRAVLCPTGTLPPEGFYKAGIIAPGPVGVFGWDYSRERAITKTPNVELLTLRDGTRHAYQAGGRRKKVAFSWAEGVDETQLRLSVFAPTAAIDYVTTSGGGAAMALRQDGPFFMWGLMDRLDGPALPVVYIPRITFENRPPGIRFDPRQNNRGAIYSRLTSPITLEQVVGDEETSEVYRVNSVTFEEEL
jgi:hypothetical protein